MAEINPASKSRASIPVPFLAEPLVKTDRSSTTYYSPSKYKMDPILFSNIYLYHNQQIVKTEGQSCADIKGADVVFLSVMIVQKDSMEAVVARCREFDDG